MQIHGHDIGVCSWSLRPGGMDELVRDVAELGLSHLHLALQPLLFLDDKRKHFELGFLRDSGLTLTAGMISFPGEDYSSLEQIRITGGLVPAKTWPLRKMLTLQAGRLAHELGITLLTTHGGFIPASNHADYPELLARFDELAKALAEFNVTLGLETGQEEAPELLQFINDLPSDNIAVNFDPANMILYGAGDPAAAVRTLSRHVRHVHIKDAIASEQPGLKWGTQVPVGAGQVDFAEVLAALHEAGYRGPLMIEQEIEGGVQDIRGAIETLKAL